MKYYKYQSVEQIKAGKTDRIRKLLCVQNACNRSYLHYESSGRQYLLFTSSGVRLLLLWYIYYACLRTEQTNVIIPQAVSRKRTFVR